ncbi:MAG: hypothetical protein C0518_01720 [Opitutus sp.]|nr:hypothetical protein [Opitutus sp.]
MKASSLQWLAGRTPAWKFEWESLLRREPSTSALGHPDTLVYKMDETIREVLCALQRQPRLLRPERQQLNSLERHCACLLNPLSKFYATGEVSLHAVAVGMDRMDLDEALRRFRFLGLEEIESLCGVCQNRLKPGYPEAHSADWEARCAAYRG